MKYRVLNTCIISLLVLSAITAQAQTWTKPLADGITLTQTVERPTTSNAMPTKIINILRIDPRAPGVRVMAAVSRGRTHGTDKAKGRDSVSSIAKRLNAVAAVNAGYFWQSADPLSLHVSGGELVSEPYPGRVAFGITSDGRFLFDRLDFEGSITLPDGKTFRIRGINRSRGQNELIAYTPRFYSSTCTESDGSEVVIKCGNSMLAPSVPMTATVSEVRPHCGDTEISDGSLVLSGAGTAAAFIDQSLTPGTVVTIQLKLKPMRTSGWEKVTEAVSGGPWLVRDGDIYVDYEAEGIKPDIFKGRHARTAVGATSDGHLVIATVGGWRRTGGMTLTELARLMKSQGCVNAINLDGGGSTTMASASGVLNCPADITERYVADALAVFGNTPFLMSAKPLVISGSSRGEPILTSRAGRLETSRAIVAQAALTMPVLDFQIEQVPTQLLTGYPYRFFLVDSSTGQPLDARFADQAVWSVSGGVGFVDQLGILYAARAHAGTISARIGQKTASIPIEVFSTQSGKLAATFQPDPSGDVKKSLLTVSLTDSSGNPITGRKVVVKITGGVPDCVEAATDENGQFAMIVTWNDPADALDSALIEAAGVPSLTVRSK